MLWNGGSRGWTKCTAYWATSNGAHSTSPHLDKDPHNGREPCFGAVFTIILMSFGCCRPLFNHFPWSPEARLRLPWSAFTTRSYASNYGSQLQRERLKGPRLKFTSSDLSLTLYDPNPTWTAVYRKCPKTAWVAQGKIFLEYPHVLCFVLKLSRA